MIKLIVCIGLSLLTNLIVSCLIFGVSKYRRFRRYRKERDRMMDELALRFESEVIDMLREKIK